MSKLKAGLFSMEAKGSIANSLTFQHEARRAYVRSKPTPTDPLSLAQQYQRWLYQDYVAWWHDQTPAVKATWESSARPYHMSGFAYWMRDMLTNLPDISLGLHLDWARAGSTTDFSKNNHTASVFGTAPLPGRIDQAFSFDGLDDYISIPHAPSLSTVPFTFDFFIFNRGQATHGAIITKRKLSSGEGDYDFYVISDNRLWFAFFNLWWREAYSTASLALNAWSHVMFTWDNNTCVFYINGQLDSTHVLGVPNVPTTQNALIGKLNWPGIERWQTGIIDHFIYYNRLLTPADALRHSLRRYPS